MAVEAARDVLVDRPRGDIAALALASTTMPFADLQNSAIVAGARAAGIKVPDVATLVAKLKNEAKVI